MRQGPTFIFVDCQFDSRYVQAVLLRWFCWSCTLLWDASELCFYTFCMSCPCEVSQVCCRCPRAAQNIYSQTHRHSRSHGDGNYNGQWGMGLGVGMGSITGKVMVTGHVVIIPFVTYFNAIPRRVLKSVPCRSKNENPHAKPRLQPNQNNNERRAKSKQQSINGHPPPLLDFPCPLLLLPQPTSVEPQTALHTPRLAHSQTPTPAILCLPSRLSLKTNNNNPITWIFLGSNHIITEVALSFVFGIGGVYQAWVNHPLCSYYSVGCCTTQRSWAVQPDNSGPRSIKIPPAAAAGGDKH